MDEQKKEITPDKKSVQLNKKVKRHQMLLDVQRTRGGVSIEEL